MRSRTWVRYAFSLIALLTVGVAVLAQQQTPVLRGNAPPRGEKHLLYVATPGSSQAGDVTGYGILVFDVRNHWRFIKRIPTFGEHIPAWADQNQDEVKGMEIIPELGMLYLGTLNGMSAFSLLTEKLLWEKKYDWECCDRLTASPDGKIIYAPQRSQARGDKDNGWIVVEAATGKFIKRIPTPRSTGSHNSIYSPDGTKVFMAGTGGAYVSVADTKTHEIIQTIGPFSAPPAAMKFPNPNPSIRPFTINGAGTLVFVNVNGLLGFEVGDVKTGKVLHRVEPPGYTWTREQIHGEGNATHGIAMSPDEKELWVTDNVNGLLHVFDATVMPPKYVSAVKLPLRNRPNDPPILDYPYWVTFGLDGKYVYPSTGDVIDAATKKIVGGLVAEDGKPVRSEKIIEVVFRDGKVVRASDQWGYGQVVPKGTN